MAQLEIELIEAEEKRLIEWSNSHYLLQLQYHYINILQIPIHTAIHKVETLKKHG